LYSDLFRYSVLHQMGGWWSDLDVVCLKPFDFDDPYVICQVEPGSFGTGVVKSVKDSLFFAKAVELCRECMSDDEKIGCTGPNLFDVIVNMYSLKIFEVPSVTFYPFPWLHPGEILKDITLTPETYAVHVSRSVFVKRYDKDKTYDENCLYERWKKKYL